MQRDRGMVGVPDMAPDVDTGIAPHGAPAPALRLRVVGQDDLVLLLGNAPGLLGADVDRLAARTIAKLDPVWLAAVAAGQRFIGQDQLLVDDEARNRQEEPFTLTDEGGVLAAAARLERRRLPAWALRTSAGLRASLAWPTVPTGAASGMPATNQWRSSWPQRNLLLSLPSRTSSSRWRSAGCTSRMAISASAPGRQTISKNSPLRSACTSREITPSVRLRRDGRSATFRRAPMRANLISRKFVSIQRQTLLPGGSSREKGR